MNPFFLLAVGVAISMLVIPFAWRLAPSIGMIDLPDARKVHQVPVPRIGGWGIVFGTLVSVAIAFKFNPLIQSFIAGSIVLFLFGSWDDARPISHWIKFPGQILAACAVVYYGGLYISRFPFIPDAAWPEMVAKPFTVFAIVGMINAINHSDGLDGLAGGESMLCLIAIAFLGYLADDMVSVGIAFATIGGILGFLRYNTYPAQVFMGDSGSQFLGFTLGFLAVYLTQVAHPALSPALPLLFLGLPIADILVVFYKRIRGGMNWFKATRNHVHHRLLDLGFDHYETVVIIYSVQALLVVSAVMLRYQSDALVVGAYLFIVGMLFVGLSVGERIQWRARHFGASSGLTSSLRSLKRNRIALATPLIIIAVIIPCFLLGSSVWVAEVPRDFGIASAVLAVVVLIEIWRHDVPGTILMRGGVYVATVFCSYLVVHFPGSEAPGVHALTVTLIAILAVAIAVFIRFTSDRKFGTTPTDYLIVFGMLALVLFGNTDTTARGSVHLVVYAIVLLYGCEVIVGRMASRWHIMNIATVMCLAILGYRGLLE